MRLDYLFYIFVMALTTYLVRMLPFTLFRKKITSKFAKSFFYYIPYAVLAAMTIPSIFYSTDGFLESCQIQKMDEDYQIIETTYTQYREDGGVLYVHFIDYIKRLLDEKTYFPSGKLSLHWISNIDTGKVSWVEYNEDGSIKSSSN